MRLWDLEGDKAGQATLLQSGGGGNFGAVIAPDGRTFLVVQGDGTLVEWDIASAKPLRTMPLGELPALAPPRDLACEGVPLPSPPLCHRRFGNCLECSHRLSLGESSHPKSRACLAIHERSHSHPVRH
jgi:hypothetical protein